MAVSQHVTLADLLEVQDGAISEVNGWSLLHQSTVTLLERTKSSQSSWLVTPDTMLLYRSGAVKFCPGLLNADGNRFIAPELYRTKHFHSIDELEKTYVYSLGMTIYYGLDYQSNGQTEISEQLEDVLNKMTIEAGDERISLDSVNKVCKVFQGKNASVNLSSKISQMVESVLGEPLEFSYDLPHNLFDNHMDDESLERELQRAASMKTSSERLSSCGTTGSALSLTSSYQGLLGSAGSFRRVARHHSNVSIKSLGSSSHDWSTGLAASLPLPSQRWSSYDGLHAPPTLNPGALSFKGERRQLPISPTIPQSVTVRRHSVSQEVAHIVLADNRRKEEQKLSRPKSADVSGFQEISTVSNEDKSLNDSLELPQLHPPPLKKFLVSLDTPPSPVPMVKLSPKVAASLEKINQLLASDSPLQQTDITNSVATESDLRAVDPVVVNTVKHHTFQPSPLLNDRLLPTANGYEIEEKAPPVPLSSPPDESDILDTQEKFSNATSQIQSSKNGEDSTVNASSNYRNQSKQQMDNIKIKLIPEKVLATSHTNVDSSHIHQQLEVKIEQNDDNHRIVGQHKQPRHQQEQLTKVELQQQMPQHKQQEYRLQQLQQQHKQQYRHKQEQHEQKQHLKLEQQRLQQEQEQQQLHEQEQQQLQQEQEQQRHKLEQQQRRHGHENQQLDKQEQRRQQRKQQQQQHKQKDEQLDEQKQQQHEQEQQQHKQEEQRQHEQEEQQHEQEEQRQYEQEEQQHEQEEQQHEQEEERQHEQEEQQRLREQEEQEEHQHEQEEERRQHEQEEEQQHEQEQQHKQEEEQLRQLKEEQQRQHEQEDQQQQYKLEQKHEQEEKQQHEQEEEQKHEQEEEQQYEHEQEQQQYEQELLQQQQYEQEQQLDKQKQQKHEEEQQQHEQDQQQHEQEQQLEHEKQQQEQGQQQRHEQAQYQKNEQKKPEEQLHEQEQHIQDYQQQQPQNYELEHHKLEQKHEGDDMLTSMTAVKNATPESTQMTSTFHSKPIDTEEPEYTTVADTKRMVLKLVTPYAVTELSRARSEHQIDKNKSDKSKLHQPLARSMDSLIDDTNTNTLQMAGTEYNQAYSKKVAIDNDATLMGNSHNNLTTAQDTSNKIVQPLLGKDTDVKVTVFPGTLQNDDYGGGGDSKEHSVPCLMMDKNKKESIMENNLKTTSNEIKLRHTSLQTSAGLLMKSNSTEDFKGSGVEVNDPRRHSALPVSNDFGSDADNDVPDCNSTATSAQVIVGEKFEPTYDEDWRQLQVTSVEKLQNVLGPEFTSLVGGKLEGNASTRPIFYGDHSNRRQVNVVLLNDKIYSVTVELSSKCHDVFNQVISYLSLGEPHVFGLSIVKGEEDYFINLNKRLIKYAPDGWLQKTASSVRDSRKAPPVFTVYFRIRFFVENVHELKTNQTRHQYYLQLRRDIQLGKIYCYEETALLLASYALQVEKGDYGPALEGKEYYQLENYMPKKAIDQLTKDKINSVLPHMHSELKGLSKESAQWQFLQEVQKLTEYGQIFYQLYKDKQIRHSTVVIGFCVRGLILYDIVNKDIKIPTYKLSWKQIENIVFKQRRFELHIIGSDEPLVYYVLSPKKALYLFGLAKSYHYFQLKCREPTSARSESCGGEPVPRQKPQQCEVIKLLKEPVTGLGFKIMSGRKKENREGIFVKSIIKGTPAYIDGRMKPFDQIVAINGVSVAGCDHKDVGRMVQQSPPLIQITVIHHHHDEEEHLLSMSYNKQSPLSDSTDYEQQAPIAAAETRLNFNDDTKYQTVSVTKDNNHLGFDVKGSGRGVYISNLEPGTATARKKLLKVGSVIVAVNGQSVEGQTVHEVLQLLLNCHYHMELTVKILSDYSSSDDDTYVEGDQFVVNIDRGDNEDFGLQIVKKATVHCPTGLFFVKSIIPESPAHCCNKLMENDIILRVNDKIMKDCTNDEARQILYKAGQHISLLVCRSVIGMLSNSSSFVDNITPLSGSRTSIRDTIPGLKSDVDSTMQPRSSHTSINNTSTHRSQIRDMTTPPHSSHTSFKDTLRHHEVKLNVTLIKGETSFGITIDKQQSGQAGRGIFILAVDSEPALSNGKLHQGDEIIKVNDNSLIDQPHQAAINVLRQIKPSERADLVIRRRLKVEEFEVSFCKENTDTTLGLVVGRKPLLYDQEQQMLGVMILQIHSSSLAGEDGLLRVGDFIDKINDVQISSSVDKAAEMLKEAIGSVTLWICRYPSNEISELQPILSPLEDQLSSEALPLTHQVQIITTEDPTITSLTVEDTSLTTEDPMITSLIVEDTLPTTEDPMITSPTVEDTLPTTEDPMITSPTVEDTLLTTEDPMITSPTVEDMLPTTEDPMITSLTVEDTLLTTEDPMITSPTVEDMLPTTEDPMITSLKVEDMLPSEAAAIEGSSTPPPPLSSPPPLSPAKGVDGVAEKWSEPQLNYQSFDTAESCSSLNSEDADTILDEIDQSTYHTNLSIIDAKGMNDSLGTLSTLSEDITQGMSSDSLTESHNSMHRPPLPLSPPPDL